MRVLFGKTSIKTIWQNKINIDDLDKIISYMHLKLQSGVNFNVRILSNWYAHDRNAKLKIWKPNHLAKHVHTWWRATLFCMAPFLTNPACSNFISHSFPQLCIWSFTSWSWRSDNEFLNVTFSFSEGFIAAMPCISWYMCIDEHR